MMNSIGQYLFSVLGAAVICGVLRQFLSGNGPGYSLGKMLCGLFLLFTLLSPISNIRLQDHLGSFDGISMDAQEIAAAGAEKTKTAFRESITKQIQAYILDKAATYDANLDVTVILSDADIPVPVQVYISGRVSPYGKTQLQTMIVKDLGISKEDQIWT